VRSRAPIEKILENTKQIARSSLSLWKNKTYSSKGSGATVGFQQNRVSHFYRKTIHQDKYYSPQPITAGLGLTPLKTKAKGQVPKPPQRSFASSNPSPSPMIPVTSSRCPSPGTSSRHSTPLHSYCFARPSYCNTMPRARTDPYRLLLRNWSSPRHAGLPGNL
jgi:hypothetical protein